MANVDTKRITGDPRLPAWISGANKTLNVLLENKDGNSLTCRQIRVDLANVGLMLNGVTRIPVKSLRRITSDLERLAAAEERNKQSS